MKTKLELIIKESGLQPAQAKPLLDSFGDFFVQAHKIIAKSKGIKVTSEDQIEEMKTARELRIQLKNLRNKADGVRIALKEGYLRGGSAVQAIFNDIRNIVKPEEDRLEEQEKFAEIQAEKRKAEKITKRVEILSALVDDITPYNYSDMPDEAFRQLVLRLEKESADKKQAELEAEKERIAQEKKEALEREEIRKENEKLRKEAEVKEKIAIAERTKYEAEIKKQQEEADRLIKIEKDKTDKLLVEEKAKTEKARLEQARIQKLLDEQITCPRCHFKFNKPEII